jgi:hypothetical protein
MAIWPSSDKRGSNDPGTARLASPMRWPHGPYRQSQFALRTEAGRPSVYL